MFEKTNIFFNPRFLGSFNERELRAKTYNKPFSVVEKFLICGHPEHPIETIPKELQVFNEPIVYLYIFHLDKTLEWHKDEMRLDFKATAKYAAILEGKGTLEIETPNGIDALVFDEKNRWVKFDHLSRHRFIVEEPCIMIMAITLPLDEAETFDKSYYWSTEVNAINKIVWEKDHRTL